jgi:hypothetical protein
MKALKIIGIILGILIALILIVPLFSPGTAEVSSEIEIGLEPEQIFPSVASFENRTEWDPWLTTDSTATATIDSKPGYVGSTYAWKGDKVSFGSMEVISVKENEYIEAHLWFGGAEDHALVEWIFTPTDGGTMVTWSFEQATAYPFGRLGMMIGKVFLQQSFDLGLSNLKAHVEANPPSTSYLGPITVEPMAGFEALVARGAGTMEEMGGMLGNLYGTIFAEASKQQLEVSGAAFVHYLDYDEATDFSNFLAGIPVNKAGMSSGDVMAKSYPEVLAIQALHSGPYEKFAESYAELESYIYEINLDVTGEGLEIYKVGMNDDPDPANWQTQLIFPLK